MTYMTNTTDTIIHNGMPIYDSMNDINESYNKMLETMKAIMSVMTEEQLLQIIAQCPEALDLVDDPTEAMIEVVNYKKL